MSKPSFESIVQAFNVYANRPENANLVPGKTGITDKDLRFVLEDLGQKITELDLQDLFTKMDTNHEGVISFEQFYHVMADKLAGQELYEPVMSGFKYLDKDNKGYIDVNEFRYLMATFGEKFPLDEIKLMIEVAADPDDPTKIRYEKFVNKLFFKDEEDEDA